VDGNLLQQLGILRLGVANDVFNNVGTSGLAVLPCCTWSATWHHAIGLPCIVAVPGEWSTVLAMHVDVSYAAPQAPGIVNVALHREYSPAIIFIFSQGRKDLYHVWD
jgi:hypothetical protein